MELKVWVDGIERVVCGAGYSSTCQDVVIALASAMGQIGRFTLVEKWRDTERTLAPSECPLQSLRKWGEYAGEVHFCLIRAKKVIELDKSKQKLKAQTQKLNNFSLVQPSQQEHLPGWSASLKRSSTFSGAHKVNYAALPSFPSSSSSSHKPPPSSLSSSSSSSSLKSSTPSSSHKPPPPLSSALSPPSLHPHNQQTASAKNPRPAQNGRRPGPLPDSSIDSLSTTELPQRTRSGDPSTSSVREPNTMKTRESLSHTGQDTSQAPTHKQHPPQRLNSGSSSQHPPLPPQWSNSGSSSQHPPLPPQRSNSGSSSQNSLHPPLPPQRSNSGSSSQNSLHPPLPPQRLNSGSSSQQFSPTEQHPAKNKNSTEITSPSSKQTNQNSYQNSSQAGTKQPSASPTNQYQSLPRQSSPRNDLQDSKTSQQQITPSHINIKSNHHQEPVQPKNLQEQVDKPIPSPRYREEFWDAGFQENRPGFAKSGKTNVNEGIVNRPNQATVPGFTTFGTKNTNTFVNERIANRPNQTAVIEAASSGNHSQGKVPYDPAAGVINSSKTVQDKFKPRDVLESWSKSRTTSTNVNEDLASSKFSNTSQCETDKNSHRGQQHSQANTETEINQIRPGLEINKMGHLDFTVNKHQQDSSSRIQRGSSGSSNSRTKEEQGISSSSSSRTKVSQPGLSSFASAVAHVDSTANKHQQLDGDSRTKGEKDVIVNCSTTKDSHQGVSSFASAVAHMRHRGGGAHTHAPKTGDPLELPSSRRNHSYLGGPADIPRRADPIRRPADVPQQAYPIRGPADVLQQADPIREPQNVPDTYLSHEQFKHHPVKSNSPSSPISVISPSRHNSAFKLVFPKPARHKSSSSSSSSLTEPEQTIHHPEPNHDLVSPVSCHQVHDGSQSSEASLEIEEYNLDKNFPDIVREVGPNSRAIKGDAGKSLSKGQQRGGQVDMEYLQLLKTVGVQQQQLKEQQSQINDVSLEITVLEREVSSEMNKLDMMKAEAHELDKVEAEMRAELEDLEKDEWEKVAEDEQKKEGDMKLQLRNLKDKLELVELKFRELNHEADNKSSQLKVEKEKIDEERERSEELERKTLAEVSLMKDKLADLNKEMDENKKKLKDVERKIQDTDEDLKKQESKVKALEAKILDESSIEVQAISPPEEQSVVAPVPVLDPVTQADAKNLSSSENGEVVLKILEGHLSPRSPVFQTGDGGDTLGVTSAQYLYRSAYADKNPNGVWV